MTQDLIEEVDLEKIPEPDSAVIVITTRSGSVYQLAIINVEEATCAYNGGKHTSTTKEGTVGCPPHLASGMFCPGHFRVGLPAELGHTVTSLVQSIEVKYDKGLADGIRAGVGR